jgi:fumarate hydratase class II
LRTTAQDLTRIANDIRLLSSGPTTGLAEITCPTVQPGSSIMPGKVNPVMAEMLDMAMFHIMGSDLTVLLGAQAGQLFLITNIPPEQLARRYQWAAWLHTLAWWGLMAAAHVR